MQMPAPLLAARVIAAIRVALALQIEAPLPEKFHYNQNPLAETKHCATKATAAG
jgi:hypothetical protein